MRRLALLWTVLSACSGTITAKLPDLTAENLRISPLSIAAGEQGTITVTLANAGTGDVGTFGYEIWLGGGDGSAPVRLAQRSVEQIGRGLSETHSFQVTIPPGTRPGLYQIQVVVDPADAVRESNEENNRVPAQSPLNVLPRGSDVNLIPENVTLSVTNALPEDSVTISYNIRNRGTDGLLAGNSARTGFYLSTDAIKSDDDRKLGEQPLGAIGAQAVLPFTGRVTIPADVPEGSYYLLVVADDGKAIPETGEDDNVQGAPLRIGAAGTIRGIDLVVSELTVTPNRVARGGGITVNLTVRNRGDTAAASSFVTRIFLAATTTLVPSTDQVLGTANVSSLGAGESRSFERSLVIPAERAPGTYYVAAFADASNVIPETNEDNNVRVDTGGLEVTPPAQSDLSVQNVTLSGINAGRITAGSQVGVRFELRNGGPDASGSITANILLSTTTSASSSARLLKTVNVVNLTAGQTLTLDETVTIPTDIDNRRYFIGVVVDPDQRVNDPSRANNTSFEPTGFTVSGGGGCTDDEFEPNDDRTSPRSIQPGTYELLYVCSGNDDWYAVNVPAGSSIKVGISSPASNVDLDLQLYAPGGTSPIDSSAASGSTEEVDAQFVTIGGDYLVRVYAFSGFGPYRMTVEVIPAGGNGIDLVPVNASFTPRHADPGETVTVELEARNVGMVDSPEFAFSLTLIPADTTCPAEVALGTFTTAVLPAGQRRTIGQVATVPQAACRGDYYLRVVLDPANTVPETYDQNNTLTTTAKFTVGGVGGCVDDTLEPNDTASTARVMAPGTYNDLKICQDDDDYYAVFLGAGEQLEVVLTFTHSQGDLDMQLLRDNGSVITSSSGTTNTERVTYTATGNERVVIRVYGFLGATNTYSMTITGGAGVDLTVKDASVAPLVQAVGEEVNVRFTVENLLPLQSATTNAEVRLRSAGGQTTTLQTVAVPALGPEASDGVRKAYDLKFRLPADLAAATYDLLVVVDPANTVREANESNNTATITGFRVAPACTPDALEPNDSAGEAKDATPGSGNNPRVFSNLNICLGDADWFSVVIGSGETRTLVANISFTHANGDLDLYLHRRNPNGTLTEVARSTTNTSNEQVSLPAPAAATYFVQVAGFNSATNPSYTLSVALQPPN